MTVKRRFKTLMLRKKKRREADAAAAASAAQKDHSHQIDESDTNGAPQRDDTSHLEKEEGLNKGQSEVGESSAGQIDLNSHPNREDMQMDITGLGMSSHHLETRSNPVRENIDQNGLRSFSSELQNGHHSSLLTHSNGEGQRHFSDERCFPSRVWNQERRDEVYNHPNQSQNSLS